jgi:hypothetical protein
MNRRWHFALVMAGLGLGYAVEPWPLLSAALKLAALAGAIGLFWRAPAGADMARAFRFTIFGLLAGLVAADLAGRFVGLVLAGNETREILLVFTFIAMAVAGLSDRRRA